MSYTSGSVVSANLQSTNLSTSTLFASTGITTAGLAATTITGANMSLSGNLSIAGTLTAVNVITTNLIDTNISTGTLTASGLSALSNVTSSGITSGTLLATGAVTASFNSNTIGSLFTTSGNVGINTTSPGYRLEVNGSARVGSLFSTSVPASATAIPLPKAAGAFSWNGSSLVTNNLYNCSIVRNVAGNYRVTFTTALSSSTPIITTSFQRVGSNDFVHCYGFGTGGVDIQYYSGGAATDNPNYIAFVVF